VEILRFGLLGLGTGAVYAVLALGLVLVHRGSGLLNFAQGAMALVGAYVYYEVTTVLALPTPAGLGVAVVVCALLGAALHLLILRPMRHTSPLSRVIAVLGVTLTLQALAYFRYGYDPLAVVSLLPTETVALGSDQLLIGLDRMLMVVIGVALLIVLTVVYQRTAFGRATTAVAENQVVAASLGHSPDIVAAVNWAVGSALAAVAGVLISPIIFLEPTGLVMLVIPAMATALVGGFASFFITVVAALGLGVAQSEIQRFVADPGWPTAAPFLLVIALLALRGRTIPVRGATADRMAATGTGRVRPALVAVLYAAGLAIVLTAGPDWVTSLIATFAFTIICLSVVVVTGYTGQLSLAQPVLAGVGALVCALLVDDLGFGWAAVVAVLVTALAGGLVGLPALRMRGMALAIVTLGLASAISAVLLLNGRYTGGIEGITVEGLTLFGIDLDPFLTPERYGVLALTVVVIVCVGVANLRRSRTGRRMLAVRSNERAAAAIGVPNAMVKTYAFALAAGVAAIGGVLLAFAQPTISVGTIPTFTVLSCILVVAVTVAGGVGFVGGAVIGATMIAGGIVSKVLEGVPHVDTYLPIVSGLVLVGALLQGPDGLFELNRQLLGKLVPTRLRADAASTGAATPHVTDGDTAVRRVAPEALTVTDLTVRFGGVTALAGVDLRVEPGEVHGLIGPNGAGKTTLIDAITGFVATAPGGTVTLGDTDVSHWPTRRRAAAGLSRSFQSLELFDDLTVLENLAVASETPSPWRYLLDLVRPGRAELTPVATEALRQFDLMGDIGRRPTEISFGKRKMVAIARAMATGPSVLLLDEPAAGLDDREAAELAELIRTVAQQRGVGVLLVEHKVDMVMSISDRVTVLKEGSVLFSGTPAQVRADNAVIDAYLGAHDHAPTTTGVTG
jgi:ABC-type branched-subunit amino acid transport system ATPase component/branched-subunit amino acid ABC-type transport system permease component